MSLQGSNKDGQGLPWDIEHIFKTHPEARNCFHIVQGYDGTGDIYNWKNVQSLHQFISTQLAVNTTLQQTNGLVDLVVADGGFEAQRDLDSQEEITCQLIGNQVAAGLCLLKPGGNFCIKMFGFQTTIIQNILELLSQCFETIQILKPMASRPASAERYVVAISRNINVDLSLEMCEKYVQSRFETNMFFPCSPCLALSNFLLAFEHDLLLLNIKACKHILTVLNGDTNINPNGNHNHWSTNFKNHLRTCWLLV